MAERVYLSDSWMNEKTNLDYTAYFGHHADERAAQVLTQSRENLKKSEEILAESRKELLRAQIALANMEIQNLMTKFSHYTAAQQQDEAFAQFWANRSDVALSFPGFRYEGREALKSYLQGVRNRKAAKLEELKAQDSGLQVSDALLGAGFTDCLCLCTPYLVIAEDGKTAQGTWNLMRMATESVAGEKTLSNYWFERWSLDLVLEDASWKIWHMTVREDLCEEFHEDELPPGPMQLQLPRTGGNSPPGNLNMSGGMPFMMGGPGRLQAPRLPSYPAPYETLDQDSLFAGATRARNDVGSVPESMMHLPFADAQKMGPGGGKKGPDGPGDPGEEQSPSTEKGGPAK